MQTVTFDYPSLILNQIRSGCRRLRINFDEYHGDLEVLAEAIGESRSILRLTIVRSRLGPKQCKCLGTALAINTSIDSLGMRDCELATSGCEMLSHGISKSEAPLRKFMINRYHSTGGNEQKVIAAVLQRPGVQVVDV